MNIWTSPEKLAQLSVDLFQAYYPYGTKLKIGNATNTVGGRRVQVRLTRRQTRKLSKEVDIFERYSS